LTDEREITIRDAPEEVAYVIDVDGTRAGRAEYRMSDGRHVFTHTETDDSFSGQGIASRLVKYALEDVRAREGRVVPLCPFFASYIKRHPEYEDLVDHEMTMEFKKRQKRS
jgi:predicted GNAT family acetyltransferase